MARPSKSGAPSSSTERPARLGGRGSPGRRAPGASRPRAMASGADGGPPDQGGDEGAPAAGASGRGQRWPQAVDQAALDTPTPTRQPPTSLMTPNSIWGPSRRQPFRASSEPGSSTRPMKAAASPRSRRGPRASGVHCQAVGTGPARPIPAKASSRRATGPLKEGHRRPGGGGEVEGPERPRTGQAWPTWAQGPSPTLLPSRQPPAPGEFEMTSEACPRLGGLGSDGTNRRSRDGRAGSPQGRGEPLAGLDTTG